MLKETINYYHNYNSPVYVCFLDATKAFDRVNHWLLFKKLIHRGIPKYVVRILLVWYRTQRFFTQWGGARSSLFSVGNGVRQGSILSPYLFNVYMDDLSSQLKSCYKGCNIGGRMINHLMYADDLALICPSIAGLRSLVSICEMYGVDHDIIFHPKKSKCIYFMPRKCLIRVECLPSVRVGDKPLSIVHEHSYLGYTLTDSIHDDSAIKRQMKCFYSQANMLLRKFPHCTIEVKATLFRTFCSNMYCSQLWSLYNKKCLNNLRVGYNNAFRILMGYSHDCSASRMFVQHTVPTFAALRRKLMYNFFKRIENSQNSLIAAVLNSDTILYSGIHKLYRDLLYF